ncbi:MAG: ABC transporter ATP-binding protein [Desulfocapsaceae bacterium]|nr:ABC transporter ATP-binding protein [Desulfocapsaceae bacterium]
MQYVFRLNIFLRPYRLQASLALVLLATLVSLDLAIPRLIQQLIDQGINRHNEAVVIKTGLLMLGISLVSMFIAVGNNNLSVMVGEGMARDLRDALFLKIQTFSFGNLDQMKTGQLLVRLTSDIAAVQRLAQMSLRIGTRAPLLMTGSLVLMVNTSPSLALTLAPLLAVTLAIIVFFTLRMEPLFHLVQQKFDGLNIVLQENVAGARLVKSFVRGTYEGRRFEAANEDFTVQSTRVARFLAIMTPMLTICVNIGMVIVIWVGGEDSVRGGLTVGQIVAFTNYLLTTMAPLLMMGRLANVWAGGMASAGRICQVMDTVPDVGDGKPAQVSTVSGPGRIVFEHVSFHYNSRQEEPVLADINLVVEPGEMVAILGATGAGKSTLINLVPRFYDVTAGRILLDGVDIRQLRQEDLLASIAVVPQETILFSGSVADNIRYGAPEASDEQVIQAARAAQAHAFILALPRAYDTHIEERGVNLSGGQKQRIAIARALLTRPQILILDDSTSSVDSETECLIHEALAGQATSQTRLMVAQRISTVLKADRIVVIDRGRIVACGRHRELLQTSPIYQEIYDSQLGGGTGLPEDLLSGLQEDGR